MFAIRALRYPTLVLACGFSLLPALMQAQITVPANRKSNGGLRPPAEKELIYVTLPGTLEGSWDQNGTKKYSTEVVAKELVMCGGGGKSEAPQAEPAMAGASDDLPF